MSFVDTEPLVMFLTANPIGLSHDRPHDPDSCPACLAHDPSNVRVEDLGDGWARITITRPAASREP